jgi:biopolymer transport protein ExbB
VLLEQKMSQFALLGAGWVLWLMVGLSVLCVALAFERALYFLLNRSPMAAFEAALGTFLTGGDRSGLDAALKDMKGLEARVIRAGLAVAGEGKVEAAESAMVGTLQFERGRLERGILIVGTVASSVPFVGLFGTVLGIIKAFHDLALTTGGAAGDNAGAVMSGISEALVSTAMGLAVAIPAVVLYNLLQNHIKGICGRVESMGQLVLARLQAA